MKVVDGLASAGWLSQRPERLVGQLRPTPSCRIASWNCYHRRDRQFPGEPQNEKIAADAMVATRRRSPAAGSLRRLQWRVRFHLWTEISARKRFIPANGDRSLTPNLEPVPPNVVYGID